METQNEATKRAHTESITQDNECHVRQPEQEQHMTIGDTQASAEDSDNVDFVPPERSRIAHKKALLGTLSCALARHRTLDYMLAGYPCGANGDLVMNNHRPLEQRLRHSPK
jgi:hypothetical protein